MLPTLRRGAGHHECLQDHGRRPPLAATITTAKIEQTARQGFTFYTSHVSDPRRDGRLAVLETIRKEHLIERARTTGVTCAAARRLQARYEAIGDVRRGMLLGVEPGEGSRVAPAFPRVGAMTTRKCFESNIRTSGAARRCRGESRRR
jgi:2,2-dialkylglycine decarboxylase (pyruvate)